MRNSSCVFLLVAAACGDSGSSGIPDACNPLGGQGCLLPWPSSTYEVADASTATGYRLALPAAGMPVNIDGIVVDPVLFKNWDGFSLVAPMLAQFPNGVSATGLPTWKDPSQSLTASSPIVLVDMDTGERAPFFAEVDQNTTTVAKRDLIIRPLARLHPGAHYAVGIRNTVLDADGMPLEASPGFAALRDGKSFGHPRFADMKKGASDLFAALATAGVTKDELVLAWDFRTASDEFLQSDLKTMTAAAIPAIGNAGANLTFTATVQSPITGIYKAYLGTFKSPDFLTDGEHDDSIMRRDASGAPQMQGMRDANFAALVPNCVTTQPLPRPTIIFGHGIFGSAKDYLNEQFVQQLAEQYCFIILAGDFIGLTSRQLQLAPISVNDLNKGPEVSEKLGQSIIDFISLENAARGPMRTSPEFSYNGQPVIDAAHTYYVGGSLGGIVGNTFMAYDPNLTRGVLAVFGGNWSMLYERSNAWSALMGAAQGAYPEESDYQLNIALMGMGMEPYDPITTAAHVLKNPMPGVPAKTVLMWYTIGDCMVTNISADMIAREMGVPVLAPSVDSPWGLMAQPAPLANGVNIFNAHPSPMPPDTNVPPLMDNGTHAGINRKQAALRLTQSFILQDTIVPGCTLSNQPAPCDCSTGACD